MNNLAVLADTWTTLSGQQVSIAKLTGYWLAERSPNTKDAYLKDMCLFINFIGTVQFDQVTREQIMDFALELHGAPNTKKRTISCVKSFYSYLTKNGYIPINLGAMLRIPKINRNLGQRIIEEELVLKMIYTETNKRNHCLLRLLYSSGVRVSELCSLQWCDLIANAKSGTIYVVGKGEKERTIPVSQGTWNELMAFKPNGAQSNDYVFQSRTKMWKGQERNGLLDRTTVIDIVRAAAKRAEVPNWEHVSPHWLRHCHATHALDNGATLPEIQETLGHSSIAITGIYQHIHPENGSSRRLKI